MTNEYLMHYVGNGLYNTKRFINESKRIGVQRAIQFNLLKNVKWNDVILVAQHKKIPLCNKTYHDLPIASIFGYFKVDCISYRLDEDVRLKLMDKIKVLEVRDSSGSCREERACGSYEIGSCFVVNDKIDELVKKIEQSCTECNKSPNSFKYFLKGHLELIQAPVILKHTKFNRGYRKVTIENFDVKKSQPTKGLFFLFDYERRMYMKKEESEAYDRILVEEHIEGTT